MTFRHRTILYRVSSKSKGLKVGLDLKKCVYGLFCNANNHVKEIPTLKFCYLKFIGEDLECVFFSSMDELCDMADMEI